MLRIIEGYRHSPDTDSGIETRPLKIDVDAMASRLSAIQDAIKMGYKMPTAEELTALRLKENRDDFGFNYLDKNKKPVVDHFTSEAKRLYGDLTNNMYSPQVAANVAAFVNARNIGDRLKQDWFKIWNGTGVNRYGQSGEDYAPVSYTHLTLPTKRIV